MMNEEVWCHFLSLEGIRRLRDNTFLQKKREVIRAATRVDKRTFRVSLIFCQGPFEIWAHSSFDVVYLVLLNVIRRFLQVVSVGCNRPVTPE